MKEKTRHIYTNPQAQTAKPQAGWFTRAAKLPPGVAILLMLAISALLWLVIVRFGAMLWHIDVHFS